MPWWEQFIDGADSIKLEIEKGNNGDLAKRLEQYLERLLPTLYIIRHGLGKDINQLIDESEDKLTQKHIRKMDILKSMNN